MNAELHTDLLGKDKRDEIAQAGRKLKAVGEALLSEGRGGKYNTLKEGLYGIYVDEFKKAHEKEWNLVKDTTLDPQTRLAIIRKLQTEFYAKHGYTGALPEILLTTESRSFTQDGRNEKGKKQAEKIFLSIENLNDEEIGAAFLVAHETAHLNTYEEGKSGEESSLYARSKVGKEEKRQQFTEAEKENYLQSIEKYQEKRTIAEQTAEGKAIPEEEKEHFSTELLTSETFSFEGRVSRTQSAFILIDNKNKAITTYNIGSTSVGFGLLDIGGSAGVGFYLEDTVEDLSKLTISIGGSITMGGYSIGTDLLFTKSSYIPRGVRIYGGKGISSPIPFDVHVTFIEIGNPKNIKKDSKAYDVYKKFMEKSRETGGEW